MGEPLSIPARRLDRKLRLRPYAPGDEQRFPMREDFAREAAQNAHDWSKGPPGPTWTLYRWSGDIEGVAGAVADEAAPGSWWLWALLSDRWAPKDWVQGMWLVNRACDEMISRHGARWLCVTANLQARMSVGLLQRLGFVAAPPPIELATGRYLVMVRGRP